mmetsp:Transcript_26236/g.43944  ORF Transcript_26236/g.43944 Transcript_26236/m.43944 type:complete len:96 (+) Transcript_26236:222-509(+)
MARSSSCFCSPKKSRKLTARTIKPLPNLSPRRCVPHPPTRTTTAVAPHVSTHLNVDVAADADGDMDVAVATNENDHVITSKAASTMAPATVDANC